MSKKRRIQQTLGSVEGKNPTIISSLSSFPNAGTTTTTRIPDSIKQNPKEPYPKEAILVTLPTPPDAREYLKRNITNIEPTELDHWSSLAMVRDGGYRLAKELPERYSPSDVAKAELDGQQNTRQRTWEVLGVWFKVNGRLFEAIAVFNSLYYQMLKYQTLNGTRIHKGMPLIWISECFFELRWPIHAKRYLMYTLCENALSHGPEKRAEDSGLYFRAVWRHGMSDELVAEYTRTAYEFSKTLQPFEVGFPERLLFELDYRWMTEYPTEIEFGRYHINTLYVTFLLSKLGASRGVGLEMLAQYLVSMIPGCRAYRRKRSHSTDFDVVGSFEGPVIDFRAELGRYFLCECKDWKAKANFSTMAKLTRILESSKCRFGILFSKNGITGTRKTTAAEREQLKAFAELGIAIVVITERDLTRIVTGESFLSLLRSRYERLRLDLNELPIEAKG